MALLSTVGEAELIAAIAEVAASAGRARGVRVGIGDDAAVVETAGTAILTTDAQTEDVHFRRGWLSYADLGRRAVRVSVSDVAAMGGRARYLLLSLGLPTDLRSADARALVSGVVDEARSTGASLVGGNLSRAPGLSVVVSVIGEPVGEAITRSGARAGDTALVTGTLGGAAAGVELLERGRRRGALVDAYRSPPCRLDVAVALSRAGLATAMIDVSDGLAQDLGHLCRLSGVAAVIDADGLPLHPALDRARGLERLPIEYALGGGDDYELLFTVRGVKAEARATRLCASRACMLSRVGEIVGAALAGPRVRDRAGCAISDRGFSHFGTAGR